MIFFDRSMPRSIVDALLYVREDVMWLEPKFAHNAPEAEWLKEAGASGWLVVTRDKKILTRVGERTAFIDHGVGGFVLTQRDNPKRWDILRLVVGALDDMERLFAETSRPFLYKIDRAGVFRLAIPRQNPRFPASDPR